MSSLSLWSSRIAVEAHVWRMVSRQPAGKPSDGQQPLRILAGGPHVPGARFCSTRTGAQRSSAAEVSELPLEHRRIWAELAARCSVSDLWTSTYFHQHLQSLLQARSPKTARQFGPAEFLSLRPRCGRWCPSRWQDCWPSPCWPVRRVRVVFMLSRSFPFLSACCASSRLRRCLGPLEKRSNTEKAVHALSRLGQQMRIVGSGMGLLLGPVGGRSSRLNTAAWLRHGNSCAC